MIQQMERLQPILNNPVYRRTMKQLEQIERSRMYCKHGLDHLLDVARIAALLAAERSAAYPRDVIYAAALLHDIGRLRQYTNGEPHACAGVPLARDILRTTAFMQAERNEVLCAVGRHQTGGTGVDLAQLICEADHASRMCFMCAAQKTCNWPQERRNQTILL